MLKVLRPLPKTPLLLSLFGLACALCWRTLFIVFGSWCLAQPVSVPLVLRNLLPVFFHMRTFMGVCVFYDTMFSHMVNSVESVVDIVKTMHNEHQLFDSIDILEKMLIHVQGGFGSYLLIHISMLVMMNTINSYFAIILCTLAVHYSSWYKLVELLGCLCMAAWIWARIFYICSKGHQVMTVFIKQRNKRISGHPNV